MRDAIFVLGGLAIVVFVVARQRRSERFRPGSLLFPVGLGIYGVILLDGTSRRHPVNATSAVLLTLSALASVAFGVLRGRTIELFVREGELWERASWRTIGVGWGGLLVARLCVIGLAAAAGAQLAASATSIPLMLAITLAAQMIVVGRRAAATGATFSPSRRGRLRARRGR